MRAVILVLVILCHSSAWAQPYNYTLPATPGVRLVLEGASEVLMPRVSLNTTGGNWTYPYDYYPVYSKNQTVSGSFYGNNSIVGSAIAVTVLELNTSSFQEALRELYKLGVLGKAKTPGFTTFSLNRTGEGNFSIPGLSSGLYALLVADTNNSVLSAIPVLVTDDMISVESPDKAGTEDALGVKIRVLQGQPNLSRKYGAAIVSWETYRKSRIDMNSDVSRVGMTSIIGVGNESLKIVGEPKISQSLVDQILPILPEDSALALSESNKTEAEMYLMHDGEWKPGRYVLTCGVYSNQGLGGIKQKIIEMV